MADEFAIKQMFEGACNKCGTWAHLGKLRLCHTCHNKRFDALENLREMAAMYRERLPVEVVDALDRVGQPQ